MSISTSSALRVSAAAMLSLASVAAFADDACTVPGVTVLEDAGGDVTPGVLMGAVPLPLPLDYADLLSVQVAMPPQTDGVPRLVFTINVASLETLPALPPNSSWYTSFKTAGGFFGVRMITGQSGAASFQSYAVDTGGLEGDGVSDGRFAVTGSEKTADASSNFTDGAITITVPAIDVGVVRSGETLSQFNAAQIIQVDTPAILFADTFDQIPDDLSRRGSLDLPASCGGSAAKSGSVGPSFGGAFGFALLLPLIGAGWLRRRSR